MSIIKKLAGETLIYGMASIFPRMLNILMTLVYLTYRFNDTEDYGSYNEMYAYVTIFLTILVYRLDTAYFRYGSRPENKDNVFSTALIPVIVSAIVIVGVVLVYSQSIATWLSYEDKPHYIQWFALIIGFDAVATLKIIVSRQLLLLVNFGSFIFATWPLLLYICLVAAGVLFH